MTLTTQFYTLLSIVGMGCYFGAALDTYNLFLQRSKRSSWVVFINDFLFWVVQGLVIFYILFLVNEGELRFYFFLALVCGFSAYQALFKKLYIRLLNAWISLIKKIYIIFTKTLTLLLLKPLIWLVFALITILLTFGKGLFSLAKLLLKPVLSIIKVLLIPFFWVIKKIGKFIPYAVKSRINKAVIKFAGFFHSAYKIVVKRVKRTKD